MALWVISVGGYGSAVDSRNRAIPLQLLPMFFNLSMHVELHYQNRILHNATHAQASDFQS